MKNKRYLEASVLRDQVSFYFLTGIIRQVLFSEFLCSTAHEKHLVTVYFSKDDKSVELAGISNRIERMLIRAKKEYLLAKLLFNDKVAVCQSVERDYWNVVFSSNDVLRRAWAKRAKLAEHDKIVATNNLFLASDKYKAVWDIYSAIYGELEADSDSDADDEAY